MADAVRLLVASRNTKKLNELRRILDAAGLVGIELVGLDEVPAYRERPETGETFEANALIKAIDGAEATGLPCVADDSGLCIDALHGMPGVLSARWAGRHGDDEANLHLVLGQLTDVPDGRRGAMFASACALVVPGGYQSTARGEWPGQIAREPKGANGFGYDPIFLPDDAPGRSVAELTSEEKDARSHRGRALEKLLPALRQLVD